MLILALLLAALIAFALVEHTYILRKSLQEHLEEKELLAGNRAIVSAVLTTEEENRCSCGDAYNYTPESKLVPGKCMHCAEGMPLPEYDSKGFEIVKKAEIYSGRSCNHCCTYFSCLPESKEEPGRCQDCVDRMKFNAMPETDRIAAFKAEDEKEIQAGSNWQAEEYSAWIRDQFNDEEWSSLMEGRS